jgi:hypothetical protein
MTYQIMSLIGAALILGAYLALQRGWLGREDRIFHATNLVGAALLTVVAIADQRIGFIVLEGAWTLISLPGTIRPPRATSTSSV